MDLKLVNGLLDSKMLDNNFRVSHAKYHLGNEARGYVLVLKKAIDKFLIIREFKTILTAFNFVAQFKG